MKIFAGWKFQGRKPRQAPQTAAASVAAANRSSDSARMQNVPAEIRHSPAASPSMPSAKLTMLATATMNTTVIGYWIAAERHGVDERQREVVDA